MYENLHSYFICTVSDALDITVDAVLIGQIGLHCSRMTLYGFGMPCYALKVLNLRLGYRILNWYVHRYDGNISPYRIDITAEEVCRTFGYSLNGFRQAR